MAELAGDSGAESLGIPRRPGLWAGGDGRDCATVRGIDTMVCSGGGLHNRLLAARLTFYLADFTLLFAQQLPAGDGAIAYGQAVIAAARWQAQGIQP